MAKSALEAKVEQLDAEIARLTDIRNYLNAGEQTTAAPKPKRGRKPKGLPKEEPGHQRGCRAAIDEVPLDI